MEAALTIDADNAELLKLKEDLVQVIDLTKELITAQDDTPAPKHSIGIPYYISIDNLPFQRLVQLIQAHSSAQLTFSGTQHFFSRNWSLMPAYLAGAGTPYRGLENIAPKE